MKHRNPVATGALVAAALACALALPAPAWGESLTGKGGWKATYNTAGRMVDTYSEQEYVDQVANLQPGDDITFTVQAVHENGSAADWYFSNDVIKSLEEESAQNAEGSAYEYLLTWQGPSGETRTLYDSTRVGGDETTGLNEATDALDQYIFLERMSKGQSGKVTLKVALDGETEGDIYFDTLAKVKLRFAVEQVKASENPPTPTPDTPTPDRRTLVKTGDESAAALFPFYMTMLVSGVLLLVLAVDSLRARRAAARERVQSERVRVRRHGHEG